MKTADHLRSALGAVCIVSAAVSLTLGALSYSAVSSRLAAEGAGSSDSLIGAVCPASFAAGTLVLMADGSKLAIDQVKVGDRVMAEDPATGRVVAETVDATWDHKNPEGWIDLKVGKDDLKVTDEHPFWVPALGSWVSAGKLVAGESLLTDQGQLLNIVSVERFQSLADHFNLTVDQLHTYFVGQAQILVHNCDPFPGAAARAKVPSDWGPGQPARSGGGWRWSDPNAGPGENYIRIDPANPSHPDPLQQVDHVHVSSGGVQIANHLPLPDWLQWAEWNLP